MPHVIVKMYPGRTTEQKGLSTRYNGERRNINQETRI